MEGADTSPVRVLDIEDNPGQASIFPKKLEKSGYIVHVTKNGTDGLSRDKGAGIPTDVIEKVMNPFFTTRPVGEGTGLGLSISYGNLSDHGGDLEINSREGEYTEVTVDLPGGILANLRGQARQLTGNETSLKGLE